MRLRFVDYVQIWFLASWVIDEDTNNMFVPWTQPFTKALEAEINKQIYRELFAHYTYLSMVSSQLALSASYFSLGPRISDTRLPIVSSPFRSTVQTTLSPNPHQSNLTGKV